MRFEASFDRIPMTLWQQCHTEIEYTPLTGDLYRIVESQEQIATTALVDDLTEQALLEDLLEASKPIAVAEALNLHYLLSTPFRYPPLRYGSRFGARHWPSLFYGSLTISTMLAEAAYYRHLFWSGMSKPPASGKLKTQHTVFSAAYAVTRGVQLERAPFAPFQQVISSVDSYQVAQQLGEDMRTAKVEAFSYVSARDHQQGLNMALFGPTALAKPSPNEQQAWLCETDQHCVRFVGPERRVQEFQLSSFLLNDVLPAPAV